MDPSSPQESALAEELKRVREKLVTADDPDIRMALQGRIDDLEKQVVVEAKEAERSNSIPVEAPFVEPEPLTPASEAEFRAELARTSHKLYNEEDPGTRSVLQARIAELQGILKIDVNRLSQGELVSDVLPSKKSKPEASQKAGTRTTMADLEAALALQKAKIQNMSRSDLPSELGAIGDGPVEPDPPEKVEAAEKLIQQAKVEQLRNNQVRVRELLEEAMRTAPNSPAVLELIGDDYASRKQPAKAMAAYRRASQIDPRNVQVERKLASMALALEGAAASRMNLDESAIPMASHRAAFLLSLFLPGLGHIVIGQKSKGWIILGAWCVFLAWIILMGADIAKLGSVAIGGKSQPNMIVIVPILGTLVTFIYALADFKKPKEFERQAVDRPRPPVNLPFE
ncbi:MAG: hypothetical protein IT203_04840 [Fimbriimonadaceae bacterium]|nr:hypothetical protein [Fimbriimonadaceae bacterium]